MNTSAITDFVQSAYQVQVMNTKTVWKFCDSDNTCPVEAGEILVKECICHNSLIEAIVP